MAALYEIEARYADLLTALDCAETEEEAEALWSQLDAMEADVKDRAEAYARIVRSKQAEAESYKAEAQRLARRQKAAENTAERLKARLLDCMQRLDLKDVQTSIGKWRIQMNPASCQVLDEAQVPEEFHVKQPDKIDKTAILKHWKYTGELLPGVEITQTAGLRFR